MPYHPCAKLLQDRVYATDADYALLEGKNFVAVDDTGSGREKFCLVRFTIPVLPAFETSEKLQNMGAYRVETVDSAYGPQ